MAAKKFKWWVETADLGEQEHPDGTPSGSGIPFLEDVLNNMESEGWEILYIIPDGDTGNCKVVSRREVS